MSGDVGRHQTLLGGKVDDGTPRENAGHCIGPNIISEAAPQTGSSVSSVDDYLSV
jgi:hypothetical protein